MIIKKEYAIEAVRLAAMCVDNYIPFEMETLFDGLILYFPSKENCLCYALCHKFSYGHEKGLLEIMGHMSKSSQIDGDFDAHLTAEEVFKKWSECWAKETEEKQ